jgi:hypothetical protein
MVLLGRDRDLCEALGVPLAPESFAPLDAPFNEGVEASVKDISEKGRAAILEDLAGEVVIDGDTARLLPPEPVPDRFVLPPMPSALVTVQAEARATVEAMPDRVFARGLQGLNETVAHQRLMRMARAREVALDEREAMDRAATQYLATVTGLAGWIYAARREPMRDAWWAPMDFFGLFSFFSDWMGGGE